MNNPYQNYFANQVQTASPEQVLIMLYDGAIRFLREARAAIEDGDRVGMLQKKSRVVAILTEPANPGDFEKGGEIAENLASLYDFVFREILAMQVDRDPVHARNAREVLEPLLAAWSAIPPGTGDRALRPEAGTQPASDGPTQSTPPAPEEPAVSQSISFSA